MANSRENVALEWTRAELVETLGSARRTLEAYAEALDDGSRPTGADLSACVAALHEAHGVLVMLELEAAATFAAHLETVASALAEQSLGDPAGAAESLMQGLLELPDYLDAQRAGLGDTIVPLLPVLNELRRHLRQPPLAAPHANPSFATPPGERALERFAALEGLEKVRRLRAVYQQLLLSVLKGDIALSAIETLQKVAVSMQRLCQGTPTAVLWQTFEEYLKALHEGLRRQPGALGAEAVKLLRRMDSELRVLAHEGVEALARPVSAELLQQLAGAAAERGHSSTFIEELLEALAATDISEALASSGRRALASAAAALRDDLTEVRDRVDLMLRRATGDGAESVLHQALVAPIKQISSTMALLGLESSRAVMAAQLDMLTGPEIDAAALASMADALEQVDSNLAGLSQGGKGDAELVLDAAQQAVLAEARRGLELLKQGVVDYVSSHWDVRHLQSLPESLAGIAGALRMIPLAEAAALMDRCSAYISDQLLAGHAPDWPELDRYAGAISGVDYYLERLASPGGAGAEEILEYAERSLAELAQTPRPAAAAGAPVAGEAWDAQAVAGSDPVAANESEPTAAAVPATPEAAPAAIGPAPVATGPVLSTVEQAPAATEQAPAATEQAPAATEQAPAATEQAPAATEQAPAATEQAPAATEQVPAALEPAPGAIELASAAIESASAAIEPAPMVAEPAVRAEPEVPAAREPDGTAAEQVEWRATAESEPAAAFGDEPEIEGVVPPRTDDPAHYAAQAERAATGSGIDAGREGLAAPAGAATAGGPAANTLAAETAAAQARLTALEDMFEVDDEILAVFLEEVDEVLAEIDEHLPPWQRDPGEGQHAMQLRRGFHTLKGSGRLVGANVLGEVSWSIEQMLNRVIDGTIAASPQLMVVLASARSVVPDLRAAFAARAQPDCTAAAGIVVRAERIAAGLSGADAGAEEPEALEAPKEPEDFEAPAAPKAPEVHAMPVLPATPTELPDPRSVFRDEAREHLAVVAGARDGIEYRIDESVVRAFHTLAGSAGMVGVPAIAELARAALDLVQGRLGSSDHVTVAGPAADFLAAAATTLERDLQALESDAESDSHAALVAEAARLRRETPAAPLVAALLALPRLDALLGGQQLLDDWQRQGFDAGRSASLGEVLRDIVDLARAPDYAALAELAGALHAAHDRLRGAALEAPTARALLAGHERLLGQIDALVAGQSLRAATDAIATLTGLEPPAARAEPTRPDQTRPVDRGLAGRAGAGREEIDAELVEIFREEADELLHQMDQAVQSCAVDSDPHDAIEALLRALHTLKGGARLAGFGAAGDAAHEFESWLIALRDSGAVFDPLAVAHLHDRYDGLAGLIATVGRASAPERSEEAPPARTTVDVSEVAVEHEPATAPVPASAAAIEVEDAPAHAGAAAAPAGADPIVTPVAAPWFVTTAVPHPPPATTGIPATAAIRSIADAEVATAAVVAPVPGDRHGAEEVVRVRSALLDELVNLAGENSIIRGRVQQGLAEFGGSLDEMEMTIQRLREQLRRLEIETEAQILFRRERPDGPGNEDFDPLELDRYSQLQQLSRSLSESASDMFDLKETLRQRAGETEVLLVQQGRVNTQLQEGLMRSRMVPFARLLPRLRRTVRQAAQDLGKSVDLVAYNVEGELDRSLLDRMIAPLEHMLRNAVDHGIERPDDRRAGGKPEAGQIELRLSREAGDVVIEISDDGAGIDVARVRAKAQEQGLMAADAELSDDEIRQFIFAPGFSTARSVTQISGRGVGMDVAFSEVKRLGGSIGLTSEAGRGTRFLVRAPFTVSVNRALMISVGEDLYAVPLNTIEGIVLVRGDELVGLAETGNGSFEYAGVGYQVRHLGEYLGRRGRAGSASGSVPVVLVRSGESAVAVQVDGVQGSREIVVKGLGAQFAGVAGISGATILGDGGVVVILDLPALVRGRREGAVADRRRGVSTPRTRAVMVVDDSVTVRKVTSRLLERQGMDVLLAKDGIEAVALLQERKPDVMLLDIEMPRMDGFEVLRHIRHDARLADLPVIMISSRTGAKHKDRAAELGVSHFLGKPFQETELLTVIDEFLR